MRSSICGSSRPASRWACQRRENCEEREHRATSRRLIAISSTNDRLPPAVRWAGRCSRRAKWPPPGCICGPPPHRPRWPRSWPLWQRASPPLRKTSRTSTTRRPPPDFRRSCTWRSGRGSIRHSASTSSSARRAPATRSPPTSRRSPGYPRGGRRRPPACSSIICIAKWPLHWPPISRSAARQSRPQTLPWHRSSRCSTCCVRLAARTMPRSMSTCRTCSRCFASRESAPIKM